MNGQVITPDHPDYEQARQIADPRFAAVRPAAVVRCAGTGDVRRTLAFARTHRLPLHLRSGGHSYAGYSTGPGLVVDVSPLHHITVDAELATVGAGATSGRVARELDAHERIVPLGACPGVGIAGLTLGGGLGAVGRAYGLTMHNLREAEVVLADGRVVTCGPRSHPDLFWALRGAGAGNFGVVTRLRFATHPAPELHSHVLVWTLPHAARVVEAWQRWTPALPDTVSSQTVIQSARRRVIVTLVELHPPKPASPAPGYAAPLLDRLVDDIGAAPDLHHHTTSRYPRAIEFLREHTTPSAEGAPACQFHADDLLTRPIPPHALPTFIGDFLTDPPPTHHLSLGIDLLGGAYDTGPPTAWAHRGCLFDLRYSITVTRPAQMRTVLAARDRLCRLWAELRPVASGHSYQNHLWPALPDWQRAYYGPHVRRLRQIKAAYDPDNLFRFPHSLGSGILKKSL
ncbi:FAD-binding oxidoreductase [Actinomadura fulvescens]|uniref:FAD-binding oxidoreductase n=1 Tax=Actinomadura fulvescens TaxID=46160 RepID=UPI0031CEA77E